MMFKTSVAAACASLSFALFATSTAAFAQVPSGYPAD